jgi:hypothetical protein
MSFFSRMFLLAALALLVLFPIAANRYGWGVGSERDARIIAAAQKCAPEFRDAQGRCLATSRSVHLRRSVFGGSYGHGK